MNHYILGVFLFLLGLVTFIAGTLRWEIWIFTAQEQRSRRDEGEETIFTRRKVVGVTGMVVAVAVMMYGDF